jgi:hypothetical protein
MCVTFVQCMCRDAKLKQLDVRLQLDGIFRQTQSSFVSQHVYMPGCITIDFDGFLECLQQIARTFNINLRILIKNLVTTGFD